VDALLVNDDRDTDLTSARRERVRVGYDGFEGEAHGGLTRPSCSRVLKQYPKRGTEIRNTRQISILAPDQLEEIRAALDIEVLEPEWVGANMVLSGIPELTFIPPSSRLIFEGGASLVVDMENAPCRFPGEVISAKYPGKGDAFPKVAVGKRGVTAWVEKTGEIAVGEACRLHVPPSRIYAHA
ncbi:MAG: sulfurase, partial [Pseudomonadota bacterium]